MVEVLKYMDLILKYFMNVTIHGSNTTQVFYERLPYMDLIPPKYFRTSTIHRSNTTQVF